MSRSLVDERVVHTGYHPFFGSGGLWVDRWNLSNGVRGTSLGSDRHTEIRLVKGRHPEKRTFSLLNLSDLPVFLGWSHCLV